MELSVIVPTLNDRERLLTCLDALASRLPSAVEVVVVNGPSSDGTTGVVRDRDDVDVLVEVSERNRNVARNAGIGVAGGDVIAFVGDAYVVAPSWYDALETAVGTGADVVSGPVSGGPDQSATSPQAVAGRSIDDIAGDNVAFDRTVLERLDGFDENLSVGGVRDCAYRLATLDVTVAWRPELRVRSEFSVDGGRIDTGWNDGGWGDQYWATAYTLGKNHGVHPTVVTRPLGSAIRDGIANARRVLGGDETPTDWLQNGIAVATSTVRGLADGLRARRADDPPSRNPAGLSTRHDRAVRVYE